MFSGLDFTQKPNFCNHLSKLLRNFGRPALSLFYFFRYRSIQFISFIVAYFRHGVKPDSSPALKCGVFSAIFYKNMNSMQVIERHQLSDGSFARVTKLGHKYNFHHYGGSMEIPEGQSLISKSEAMRMLANILRDDVLELDS